MFIVPLVICTQLILLNAQVTGQTRFCRVAKKNRLCGDVSFVRDNWYFCDKIDKDKINNFLIDSKILPVGKRFFVVG